MTIVTIPYKPRFPQNEIHPLLDAHRFVVLVAHRRMGKTVLVLNQLIKCACKATRNDMIFAYVAPFRNQAEQIAWSYLKYYSGPIPGIFYNEQKLTVQLPNGAKIRLFGADNPDALRGLYFDGVVMDEVAQMKPAVWEEVIRPALADRKGWAIFIGTPKGPNLFQELYLRAQSEHQKGNPDWLALMYRVDQTNTLDKSELDSLRAEMSESRFSQEFLCDFNASSDDVLIPLELAHGAFIRKLDEQSYRNSALVMGVDVARFGDDSSVITFRQGVNCEPQLVWRGLSTMELAGRVADLYRKRQPRAVFVDGIGVGAGVVDRLRELGMPVIDVQSGARAVNSQKYLNRRAEMWAAMRDWLARGCIPTDTALLDELASLTYSYNSAGAMVLERKEDAKDRLQRSPDRADSLALTFFAPVFTPGNVESHRADTSYNPLEW